MAFMTGPLGIAHDDSTAGAMVIIPRHTFARHFDVARREVRMVREATSPFDDDRDETDTVFRLSVDGRSGYAVRADGELVYVFSTARGRGDSIVQSAVKDGADHLDCFDGYLTTLYTRNGFVENRRESNWTAGGPDVVYMVYAWPCAHCGKLWGH